MVISNELPVNDNLKDYSLYLKYPIMHLLKEHKRQFLRRINEIWFFKDTAHTVNTSWRVYYYRIERIMMPSL
jgi:hypothetical protein